MNRWIRVVNAKSNYQIRAIAYFDDATVWSPQYGAIREAMDHTIWLDKLSGNEVEPSKTEGSIEIGKSWAKQLRAAPMLNFWGKRCMSADAMITRMVRKKRNKLSKDLNEYRCCRIRDGERNSMWQPQPLVRSLIQP